MIIKHADTSNYLHKVGITEALAIGNRLLGKETADQVAYAVAGVWKACGAKVTQADDMETLSAISTVTAQLPHGTEATLEVVSTPRAITLSFK